MLNKYKAEDESVLQFLKRYFPFEAKWWLKKQLEEPEADACDKHWYTEEVVKGLIAKFEERDVEGESE